MILRRVIVLVTVVMLANCGWLEHWNGDDVPLDMGVKKPNFPGVAYWIGVVIYQSPENQGQFTLDVLDCVQRHGDNPPILTEACEGIVITLVGETFFQQIDSPNGKKYVSRWLDVVSRHPEIMATQFVSTDLHFVVALITQPQYDAVAYCNDRPSSTCWNVSISGGGNVSVCGCASTWGMMVCDTEKGDGVCPSPRPPTAFQDKGQLSQSLDFDPYVLDHTISSDLLSKLKQRPWTDEERAKKLDQYFKEHR